MHKCLPGDATHSAVFAVVRLRCPSVCHVDVSKRPILLPNFVIAWWPHHSSFPCWLWYSDGAPNRGGVYQKFAIFNPYFRNTEYRGISKYRYRTDMKKIPNTDTDSKYRYRPSSTLQLLPWLSLLWLWVMWGCHNVRHNLYCWGNSLIHIFSNYIN